jgi:hypothetical protein
MGKIDQWRPDWGLDVSPRLFAPGDANAVQRLIRANQAFQAYFFTAAHNMLNSVPRVLFTASVFPFVSSFS